MGYIYKIVKKATNKICIGQTIQDLDERWRQHKQKKSNCRYLKAAMKKYGMDNFEFKLICICFDSDLDKYECYYMNKYDTIVPNGYNLRQGGNSGRHNEETKKKISETLKNRTDIKRVPTTEIRQQISQKKTKYRIFQMNTKDDGIIINTFNGYASAAKSVGVSKSCIRDVCIGKSKTARGYFWKSELI